MIIKWRESTPEGVVEHDFDWAGAPRTKEMRWIKNRTEFRTTSSFLEALEEMDPDAIAALICILSAREGRSLKFDDVDVDPLNDLDYVLTEEERKRAMLLQTIQNGSKPETSEPGKAEISLPVQTSGTSNGALSAAVSKPSSGTTPLPSGGGTGSTSTT